MGDKKLETHKNKLISDVVKTEDDPEGVDAANDMVVAFELLNKFKKDKQFIQKEVKEVKKQGDKLR